MSVEWSGTEIVRIGMMHEEASVGRIRSPGKRHLPSRESDDYYHIPYE